MVRAPVSVLAVVRQRQFGTSLLALCQWFVGLLAILRFYVMISFPRLAAAVSGGEAGKTYRSRAH